MYVSSAICLSDEALVASDRSEELAYGIYHCVKRSWVGNIPDRKNYHKNQNRSEDIGKSIEGSFSSPRRSRPRTSTSNQLVLLRKRSTER